MGVDLFVGFFPFEVFVALVINLECLGFGLVWFYSVHHRVFGNM